MTLGSSIIISIVSYVVILVFVFYRVCKYNWEEVPVTLHYLITYNYISISHYIK